MRAKYDFIESNFMYLKNLFMFQLVFPIFTETNNIEAHNTSHRDRRNDRKNQEGLFGPFFFLDGTIRAIRVYKQMPDSRTCAVRWVAERSKTARYP